LNGRRQFARRWVFFDFDTANILVCTFVANPVFAIHRKTELVGYACTSATDFSEVEKHLICRVLGITSKDDISFNFGSIALKTEHIRRGPDFTVGDRKFWVFEKAERLF
jgi:hypothetical protein